VNISQAAQLSACRSSDSETVPGRRSLLPGRPPAPGGTTTRPAGYPYGTKYNVGIRTRSVCRNGICLRCLVMHPTCVTMPWQRLRPQEWIGLSAPPSSTKRRVNKRMTPWHPTRWVPWHTSTRYLPQHFLYFLPLPHVHGSFGLIFASFFSVSFCSPAPVFTRLEKALSL